VSALEWSSGKGVVEFGQDVTRADQDQECDDLRRSIRINGRDVTDHLLPIQERKEQTCKGGFPS
jgi:hypothetical protein